MTRSPDATSNPRFGFLLIDGWDGFKRTRVEIVGETLKRFRVKTLTRTKWAGANVWKEPGTVALVPKHAISMEAA
jgi:hypothetical protein